MTVFLLVVAVGLLALLVRMVDRLVLAVQGQADEIHDLRVELQDTDAPLWLPPADPVSLSAEKPYISDLPYDDERWNTHIGATEDEA